MATSTKGRNQKQNCAPASDENGNICLFLPNVISRPASTHAALPGSDTLESISQLQLFFLCTGEMPGLSCVNVLTEIHAWLFRSLLSLPAHTGQNASL